ncbi:MAG: helix-turn-helix domain-containing protein, partial [Candidatus Hodarchaeales archaeon]
MSSSTKYVSADEATRILKITNQTLYSYVSRGLIQSTTDPKNRKKKRYRFLDIEKLLIKK